MPLVLECEWGSCQDTFSRMENICKHMETHLGTSDPSDDCDENEGQDNNRSIDQDQHCDFNHLVTMRPPKVFMFDYTDQ